MSYTTIKLRSPFYIKTLPTTNAHYVAIGLRFWQGSETNPPSTYNYNLTKFCVDNQDFVIFEVSALTRDYLKLTFSGTYTEDYAIWSRYDYTVFDSSGTALYSLGETQVASDGYTEFSDGMNYLPTMEHLLMSNRCLQVPINAKTCIPVNGYNTNSVKFYNNGVLVENVGITFDDTSSHAVKQICYGVNQQDYYNRVENIRDGSVIRNLCVDAFYDLIDNGAVDTIVVESNDQTIISTISVKRILECKYDIFKLSFVNKFGAIQDLFMFKNSKQQLKVSDKTFQRNLLTESTFTYNTTEHQKRTILKQGNKSITLNSGYVGECLNPAFEELFLSEQIWLTNNQEEIHPVYLSDKSFKYKTHLNEKLINYDLNFEFAYDQINNIR